MKNKHLYSLLDTSFTTIGVIFNQHPIGIAEQGLRSQHERKHPNQKAPAWSDEQHTEAGYTYKVPKDWNVGVDNFVVVETSRGLSIARVIRVDVEPNIDLDADFDYKWAVQVVDTTGYLERVNAEKRFNVQMLEVERTKQREQIVDSFRNSLPEGSAARALFESTTASLAAPLPPTAPPPAPSSEDSK